MTLTQPQQRKVEQNLGLVGKVIKDKSIIPVKTVSTVTMTSIRSAALASARRHTAIKADASLRMHTG